MIFRQDPRKIEKKIVNLIKKDNFRYACYDTGAISVIMSFFNEYVPGGHYLIIDKFRPKKAFETYFKESFPMGCYSAYLDRAQYLKSLKFPIGMLLIVNDDSYLMIKDAFKGKAYVSSASLLIKHLKEGLGLFDILERI